MHKSSMLRMQWFKENYLKNLKKKQIIVVDLGSQCVPGQKDTYRVFFSDGKFKYIGVDMIEGYNVDVVIKHTYQWDEISDNFCDVLISGQAFEHIEFPWITISEIARILKPNGIICIIAPSMAKLHRYPVHCQNYFSDGLIALAKYAGLKVIHASTNFAPIGATIDWYGGTDGDFSEDSILVASKPPDWKPNNFNKLNYICEATNLTKMATGLIPMEMQEFFLKINILNKSKKHLLIYGIGQFAKTFIQYLDYEKIFFNGFVVSDEISLNSDTLERKPIWHLSKQPFLVSDVGIIIAIKDKHITDNIEANLASKGFSYYLLTSGM